MRFSSGILKVTPSFSPTACASAIMAAASARVPASATISSSVAWVSALAQMALGLQPMLSNVAIFVVLYAILMAGSGLYLAAVLVKSYLTVRAM